LSKEELQKRKTAVDKIFAELSPVCSRSIKNLGLQKDFPYCTREFFDKADSNDPKAIEAFDKLTQMSKKFEADHPGAREKEDLEMKNIDNNPAFKNMTLGQKMELLKSKGLLMNEAETAQMTLIKKSSVSMRQSGRDCEQSAGSRGR
jgi:hypothetical protein